MDDPISRLEKKTLERLSHKREANSEVNDQFSTESYASGGYKPSQAKVSGEKRRFLYEQVSTYYAEQLLQALITKQDLKNLRGNPILHAIERKIEETVHAELCL